MQFTTSEIQQILFGHFQNKTHLNERKRVYLKRIVKHASHLIPKAVPALEVDEVPAILLFSNELFFDLNLLNSLSIFAYKDKLSRGRRLNFDHEEVLLVISTFFPMMRQSIFSYVYKRISRTLDQIKPVAFVCNFPQLIDHIIAKYCGVNNIPVMTVQHGVYMPKFYNPLPFEADKADFIFVWSALYKECYERGGIAPEKLIICSPPIKPPSKIPDQRMSPKRPIFLGQALYKINTEVFVAYNRVLNELINFWNEHDIKIHYKPHPREVLSKSLTQANFDRLLIMKSNSVRDNFFSDFDVAYSINSTSLIHALCAGLLCFQFELGIPELPTEDFSQWSSIVYLSGINDRHEQALLKPPAYRLDSYFLNLTANAQHYNSQLLLNLIGHE